MTVLVEHGDDGHRREWIALFSKLLVDAGDSVNVAQSAYRHIFSREAILILCIEDAPVEFFLVAFVRGALGLTIAGFLFRPRECLKPAGPRHTLKRFLLRVLRTVRSASAISLVPEEIEPGIAQIARASIYDPQLWDLAIITGGTVNERAGPLNAEIAKRANGRRVLLALGVQTQQKGFDYFSRVWRSSDRLRSEWLFAAVGRLDPSLSAEAEEFQSAGGIVVDRFVGDAEMRALYAVADMIWSCYAPSYDQASGIFGRAVQTGVATAVREGSIVEKVAHQLDHPTVALPWDNIEDAMEAISRWTPMEHRSRDNRRLLEHSLTTVLRSLGLPLVS